MKEQLLPFTSYLSGFISLLHLTKNIFGGQVEYEGTLHQRLAKRHYAFREKCV
jgi:hypothetical protein